MHPLLTGTIVFIVLWVIFTIIFTTCSHCTTKDRNLKKDNAL